MKINQKLFGRILVISLLTVIFLIPVIFIPSEYSNSNISTLKNNDEHVQGVLPYSSIRTINCTIQLYSISPNPVFQGSNTVLYGHIDKFNGTQMINAANEPVYPVIDGKINTTISNSSNSNGDFWITIHIESYYNLFKNTSIQANTTDPYLETNCTNTLSLQVNGKLSIDILNAPDQLPAIPYQTQPYSGFTNYHITGKVTYLNGSNYDGPTLALNYAFGSNSFNDTIYTNPDGTFDYYTWLREGFLYYTISYAGSSRLSSVSNSSDFNILQGIRVDFLNTSTSVYQGSSFLIRGRVLSLNDRNFTLNDQTGSVLRIVFMDNLINVTTDNQGRFSTNINVPSSGTGDRQLSITLIQYDGYIVNKSGYEASLTINVKPPNPLDPNSPGSFSLEIIIIIIIAIAAVIGIIFFQRWRINHQVNLDRKKLNSDVIAKLKNVHILLDSGRIKEAMVYLSIIYSELAQTKFNFERKFSQTLRDFCIVLVTEFGQNPVNIYAFLQNVEKIVYGGVNPSRDEFNTVEQQFGRLFMDLTGEETAPTL